MELSFKILVNDVVHELLQKLADGVPSLAEVAKQAVDMFETGAALMKNVPQVGIEALTFFRVARFLADSSCLSLEAEAFKRLEVDIGLKKSGKLGEFVLLLKANDIWKLRYEAALNMAINEKGRADHLTETSSKLMECTTHASCLKEWANIHTTIMDCRTALRAGATHVLELFCCKKLQGTSQQFKGEDTNKLEGILGVDMSAMKVVFIDASALWPEEELFANKLVQVCRLIEREGETQKANAPIQNMQLCLDHLLKGDATDDELQNIGELIDQCSGVCFEASLAASALHIADNFNLKFLEIFRSSARQRRRSRLSSRWPAKTTRRNAWRCSSTPFRPPNVCTIR